MDLPCSAQLQKQLQAGDFSVHIRASLASGSHSYKQHSIVSRSYWRFPSQTGLSFSFQKLNPLLAVHNWLTFVADKTFGDPPCLPLISARRLGRNLISQMQPRWGQPPRPLCHWTWWALSMMQGCRTGGLGGFLWLVSWQMCWRGPFPLPGNRMSCPSSQ